MNRDLTHGWAWMQAHLEQIKRHALLQAPRVRGCLEEDDVVQICLIYVAEKAERYDPQRGTEEAFIRMTCRAAVNIAGRRGRRVHLWRDEDYSETLRDSAPTPDLHLYTQEVLDHIPERQRPAVLGLAEGYTASEFPKRFGVTRRCARMWARETSDQLVGGAM